jgi:hypothetical protein
VLLGAMAALCLAAAVPPSWAVELDEAFLRIEINATDGDVGFHGKFDGEPSKIMKIKKPNGGVLYIVTAHGALNKQGLTESFFESAEPTCAEQPLAEFLKRFPEGTYTFQGKTNDGENLEGEAFLSHALPAAPNISGFDGSAFAPGAPVVITWAPGQDLGTVVATRNSRISSPGASSRTRRVCQWTAGRSSSNRTRRSWKRWACRSACSVSNSCQVSR